MTGKDEARPMFVARGADLLGEPSRFDNSQNVKMTGTGIRMLGCTEGKKREPCQCS